MVVAAKIYDSSLRMRGVITEPLDAMGSMRSRNAEFANMVTVWFPCTFPATRLSIELFTRVDKVSRLATSDPAGRDAFKKEITL